MYIFFGRFQAPPPPPALNGNIPSRRIQTAMQPEMPACVQNAMFTKDKKPFTYTPGGIDLSQIKSPRMARRIERNANCEGVTNQPKVSPLAQPNGTGGQQPGNPGPRPMASSVGMPVQVFPTGPPPPPPAPAKSQLAPQSAGALRPSPARSPQSFEPPPMGCRPEIKIPPNPIASLRKVPKVEPKNDFWVEEYRKERSKSPMVSADGAPSAPFESHSLPEPVRQMNEHKSQDTIDGAQASPAKIDTGLERATVDNWNSQPSNNDSVPVANSAKSTTANHNGYSENGTHDERRNLAAQQQQQQDRIKSPFTTSSPIPNLPKPLSPIKSTQEPETQYYVRQPQPKPPASNNVPITGQNQTQRSPNDANSYPRVAQSPARSLNPTARVVESPARIGVKSPPPPPRVMSPVSRVVSPPPTQRSANARNVRFYFAPSFIRFNFPLL